MLAWEQANQELLWELSPSDIYDAIETHLTTLADNILNVEWEDFENVCYWIIELSEVYIKTINTEISYLHDKKWPKTRFKVSAHKMKWMRKYIKKVEDKMIDVLEVEWDVVVSDAIKNVVKSISVPFIQTLVDLWDKEYADYFDKFLITRDQTKKKKFIETVNNMIERMRTFQEINWAPEELDLTMPNNILDNNTNTNAWN